MYRVSKMDEFYAIRGELLAFVGKNLQHILRIVHTRGICLAFDSEFKVLNVFFIIVIACNIECEIALRNLSQMLSK